MKDIMGVNFIGSRLIRKWKEGETPALGIYIDLPNAGRLSTAAGTKFYLGTEEGIVEIPEVCGFSMPQTMVDDVLLINLTIPFLGELPK